MTDVNALRGLIRYHSDESGDGLIIKEAAAEIERLRQLRHEAECNLIAADANVVRLRAWAAELHRQLEKLWYTPAGVAYSESEQQAVIDVLGPTDDCASTIPGFDRAKYWHARHVQKKPADEARAIACTAAPASEPLTKPISTRGDRLGWCVKVHEDVEKRLDDTWPNDPLLRRSAQAFRWLLADIEQLEKVAYPIPRPSDQPAAQPASEPPWVRVSDRLPPRGEPALVWREDAGTFVARLTSTDELDDCPDDIEYHEGWWSDDGGWCDDDLAPTHWMPFPEGPRAADQPAARPASEPPAWQPIATAPEGRKIIVHYLNPLGNSRVVMACWYGEKSLEMEDDDGSGEYDEASGRTYAPPGWYEEHDSDEPILPLGGKPTHWMPAPAPPRVTDQPGGAQS